MQLLISIPGIGPDTAAKVIAEIVDITYFPSPKQLVKWTGLAPRVHQSGHRKNITGRIRVDKTGLDTSVQGIRLEMPPDSVERAHPPRATWSPFLSRPLTSSPVVHA